MYSVVSRTDVFNNLYNLAITYIIDRLYRFNVFFSATTRDFNDERFFQNSGNLAIVNTGNYLVGAGCTHDELI